MLYFFRTSSESDATDTGGTRRSGDLLIDLLIDFIIWLYNLIVLFDWFTDLLNDLLIDLLDEF